MNNLIQQLKDNRFPWDMWTDDECYGPELGVAMQAKAREIGKGFFLWWVAGDWTDCPVAHFRSEAIYHLRPDYEDEPEIIERKITIGGCSAWLDKLVYTDEKVLEQGICEASCDPAFIGFKFEDGCWRTSPIYYQMPTFCNDQIHPDKTSDFAVKIVLHATHVLFRRNKKE